jgi:ELWxxDGT repeat protein
VFFSLGGFELWKSDGSEAGTVRIDPAGLGINYLLGRSVVLNGVLFFWSLGGGPGLGRSSLWKSDGTPAGTVAVRSLPQAYWWLLELDGPPLVNHQGEVWFLLPSGNGMELWKTDGTEVGTIKALDLGSYTVGSYTVESADVGGTLFFTANDGINGTELWKFQDRDTDGDGLPDWWETKFFSGVASREEDPDGDGMTNWQESRAGTDPANTQSVLRLARTEPLASGAIRLQWPGVVNHEYRLLRSSALSSNAQDYSVVARRILATPPMNTYVDSTAHSAASWFYRLKLEE